MEWLLDLIWVLIRIVLVVLVVLALTAPFEALIWWAGWSRGGRGDRSQPDQAGAEPDAVPAPAEHYLVYLTGVGGFSGAFQRPAEAAFVERLAHRLPGSVVIDDVFPYSVSNNPLDGHRLLAPMWHWLQQRRERVPDSVFDLLIIARNVMQVGVSADPRYGPVYNAGVAHEIVRSLTRHGYPAGRGLPVYLVGYSGGAQIAVGAAPYLRTTLGAPMFIASVGGVLTDDPGIATVSEVRHFAGSKDPMPLVGAVLWPGRWPLLRRSLWNQVRRQGRIAMRTIGPVTHFGGHDYFSASAVTADGRTNVDQTIENIAAFVSATSTPADFHRQDAKRRQQ